MLRKVAVAAASKPHVEIRQDGDQFYIKTSTTVRTTEINFKVGEGFEEETVDGRKCRVRHQSLGSVPGSPLPTREPLRPDELTSSFAACGSLSLQGICTGCLQRGSVQPLCPGLRRTSHPIPSPASSVASRGANSALIVRTLGCAAFLAGGLLQRFAATLCASAGGEGEGGCRGRRVLQRGCHVSSRRWSGSSRVPPSWVLGPLGNALDLVSAVLMFPAPFLPAFSLVP